MTPAAVSAPLHPHQVAILAGAPYGVEPDDGDGHPDRTGRFRYQGVDGRRARPLWDRELLTLRQIGPYRDAGLILTRTPAGDAELQRAGAVSAAKPQPTAAVSVPSPPAALEQLPLPLDADGVQVLQAPPERPALPRPAPVPFRGAGLQLAAIDAGVRVEIPRRFTLLMRLRREFPRMYPDALSWVWIIPGVRAWRRAELFVASIEDELAAQARRDSWMFGQDDWERAGR